MEPVGSRRKFFHIFSIRKQGVCRSTLFFLREWQKGVVPGAQSAQEERMPLSGRSLQETPKLRISPASFFYLLCAGLCLCACVSSNAEVFWAKMLAKGGKSDFVALDLPSEPFRLAGLLREGGGEELVVYLEGDGRAFVRGRPARDPSPGKAQAYELALLDPAPTVLYLARIGQFRPELTGKDFQEYWTVKRLAPEALASANHAVDLVLERTGASRLHLIGYSGGGGLALLLAENRNDVASLVTVAGLLDIEWWVQKHHYLPLTGSLNPADDVKRIVHLPQLHLYGERDRIIVPAMSQHFETLAPFTRLRRIAVDTDHWKDWTRLWPDLLGNHVMPMRKGLSGDFSGSSDPHPPVP